MAIKQYPVENDQILQLILIYIERMEESSQHSQEEMLKFFEQLIQLLSCCEVATTSDQIGAFREKIIKVDAYIKSLMNYVTPGEQLATFVHTFFSTILKISKPSGAAGVVLNSLDVQHTELRIPQPSDSNEAVRKGVSILCHWFPCSFFINNIDFWINGIIGRLQEQKRFELLSQIVLDNIELIFNSFVIPYSRQRAANVLHNMLVSTQTDSTVYEKALQLFAKKSNTDDHESKNLIGTLMAAMGQLPNTGKESEIENLRQYSPKNPRRHSKNDLVGLVNLGNTCYMNSVLQALVMTKQFSREVLLSDIHSPLFQTIQRLLALLLHSIRPALTPRSILHNVRPPGFKPGHQQDSSEFLGHLLETLHEQEKSHLISVHSSEASLHPTCSKNETILNLQRVSSTTADDDDMDNVQNCDDTEGACALSPSQTDTENKQTVNRTIIQKTFTGKVSITYKCLNCGTESKQFDSFRDFQLSFPETETSATTFTIRDLIDYNCSVEKLDKDNQYSCDQCKMLCDGERYTSIVSAPANLVLTLKYFKYDQKYNTRTKLMHKVKYDETISVKVAPDENSEQNDTTLVHYRLYAAVVHSGVSLDSGHYFTYGAIQPDRWYRCEDTYVTNSSLTELYDLQPPNTPYILFYRMTGSTVSVAPSATESSAFSTNNANSDLDCKSTPNNTARTTTGTTTTTIGYKYELPALEELPPQLREYVNGDNITYENEWRSLQQQQTFSYGRSTSNSSYRDSDNDDPPPNSCGDSMMPSFNRYIY